MLMIRHKTQPSNSEQTVPKTTQDNHKNSNVETEENKTDTVKMKSSSEESEEPPHMHEQADNNSTNVSCTKSCNKVNDDSMIECSTCKWVDTLPMHGPTGISTLYTCYYL